MPIALLLAAVCAGLTAATIWVVLGGTLLTAFIIYVLSGQLFMAALIANIALRGIR
ncbi:hypothetical protein [Sulfitobacter noctilucicola]|uniref:Uncharacterized protein n=1 Tax=Sulfitobacter noctilucicola TaxID=1342301 RepID=A0A7W6MCG5_9RHOB|nr:hypothetical protein [Sulfitobacter noctilucicola]MBB4175697.1 hypothetical protein [Sulfitobacter noctilucicola]